LYVGENGILITGDLPLVAVPVRGMIENIIRHRAEIVLKK